MIEVLLVAALVVTFILVVLSFVGVVRGRTHWLLWMGLFVPFLGFAYYVLRGF